MIAATKEQVFRHHGYLCKLVKPEPRATSWYIQVYFVGDWRKPEEVTSMKEDYRTELKVRLEELVRGQLLLDGTLEDLKPVCSACNDSHEVWSERFERNILCTRCPVPCDKCRVKQGAYCEHTPCNCSCHDDDFRYRDRRLAEAAKAEAAEQDREAQQTTPPPEREKFWEGVVAVSAALDGGRKPLIVPPELVDDLEQVILEHTHRFVHEDRIADHTDCDFCGAREGLAWGSSSLEHKPDCVGQKLLALIRSRNP